MTHEREPDGAQISVELLERTLVVVSLNFGEQQSERKKWSKMSEGRN